MTSGSVTLTIYFKLTPFVANSGHSCFTNTHCRVPPPPLSVKFDPYKQTHIVEYPPPPPSVKFDPYKYQETRMSILQNGNSDSVELVLVPLFMFRGLNMRWYCLSWCNICMVQTLRGFTFVTCAL